MTIKEIFNTAGRDCNYDNRNYYFKSVNKVLETGLVRISVAKKGCVWPAKDGKIEHNLKVIAGDFVRRAYIKYSITPEDVLRQIGRLLEDERVKDSIKSKVYLPDTNCPKCHGRGIIPAFMHVCNGVCFDCCGLGYNFNAGKAIVKIDG